MKIHRLIWLWSLGWAREREGQEDDDRGEEREAPTIRNITYCSNRGMFKSLL